MAEDTGVDSSDCAGTILKIELVNFMCHSFTEISLGSKINFIVGE
jgi:hypothetical protein